MHFLSILLLGVKFYVPSEVVLLLHSSNRPSIHRYLFECFTCCIFVRASQMVVRVVCTQCAVSSEQVVQSPVQRVIMSCFKHFILFNSQLYMRVCRRDSFCPFQALQYVILVSVFSLERCMCGSLELCVFLEYNVNTINLGCALEQMEVFLWAM